VQALLDARFDDLAPISGDLIASITQRAIDTGPSRCTVAISTEAGE
jgi:hypothetical protein